MCKIEILCTLLSILWKLSSTGFIKCGRTYLFIFCNLIVTTPIHKIKSSQTKQIEKFMNYARPIWDG